MTIDTTPARIHVLAKPTGAICNLGCSYCFFLTRTSLSREPLPDERRGAQNYIRQLIDAIAVTR